MATPSTVHLTPTTAGVFHTAQITNESSKAASGLLQTNHEKHHIYFNNRGFHNHIAHHLLTLFALGATPAEIHKAYDDNVNYQRSQYPVKESNVQDMHDPEKFKQFLNKEQYFQDYEEFFRQEINDHKGDWQAVLKNHLFARTQHSDRLLTRMFAGVYHPIIHLGFGVEFEQPTIIVEALAQAATHKDELGDFLLTAEKRSQWRQREEGKEERSESKTLFELIHEARSNSTIRNSARWDDGNKVVNGVLGRAKEEVIQLASAWRVFDHHEHDRPRSDEEKERILARKTAEMINACAYISAGAQHPLHAKAVRYDFFNMHIMNCSLFFTAFNHTASNPLPNAGSSPTITSLSIDDRARLLEWKARTDLVMYIARGAPELLTSEIENYAPDKPEDGWDEIFRRVDALSDDGHVSKLVRALANGERVCQHRLVRDRDRDEYPVNGAMWLKAGHMAIDAAESAAREGSPLWVRNAGFEEAWENIPSRAGNSNNEL